MPTLLRSLLRIRFAVGALLLAPAFSMAEEGGPAPAPTKAAAHDVGPSIPRSLASKPDAPKAHGSSHLCGCQCGSCQKGCCDKCSTCSAKCRLGDLFKGHCEPPDCRDGGCGHAGCDHFNRDRLMARYGYFYPQGCCGAGCPTIGHYHMGYAVNPYHFDPRDAGVYAAQGYGVPMTVPLAPNVEHQYNYGWGVPSSRLTGIYRYSVEPGIVPPPHYGYGPPAAMPAPVSPIGVNYPMAARPAAKPQAATSSKTAEKPGEKAELR